MCIPQHTRCILGGNRGMDQVCWPSEVSSITGHAAETLNLKVQLPLVRFLHLVGLGKLLLPPAVSCCLSLQRGKHLSCLGCHRKVVQLVVLSKPSVESNRHAAAVSSYGGNLSWPMAALLITGQLLCDR